MDLRELAGRHGAEAHPVDGAASVGEEEGTMDLSRYLGSAQDRVLAERYGIQQRHAERLLRFCQGAYHARQLIIIVRASNPASAQYHGVAGHEPKPYGIEAKTGPSGRVRVDSDGPYYFSDYDLQGAYELRHMGDYLRLYIGNYQPKKNIGHASNVSPTQNAFLADLNKSVCSYFGDPPMFQHGTQDDYRTAGRPAAAIKNDGFVAFEHTGDVYLLPDLAALRDYYNSRPGLTWIY